MLELRFGSAGADLDDRTVDRLRALDDPVQTILDAATIDDLRRAVGTDDSG